MARVTQRKRRRRARDSPALLASSSESDGASSSEEDHERRWQRRRAVYDSKGKGKELVKDEDEEESNSESDEEEEKEEPQLALKDTPQQAADQTCGICLSEGGNERGKLDCCDHFFCFACIMEWAKVESRCPMCKQRFLTVMRPAVSGVSRSRTRSFRIPTRDQVYEPSEEELRLFSDPYQNTVCTECQEAGDEGLLLLCDRCDAAAHTYCVGLGRSVPRGDWFCQACQLLGGDSSDEEDATFELIEDDEEEEDEDGSGTESILAMLVGGVQPNVFAGRTRRSTTAQGPVALRRNARRRVRRSSLSDSPRLSEASISMSSGPRRGFFPALMESYAARTLSQQRQVQATVQNRLQNLRQNWNRYRSGEAQFRSSGHNSENSRHGSEVGDLPSSSTRGLGRTSRSTTAAALDTDGRQPPFITTRGSSRSVEARDVDRAWANMNRAIRLEGNSAGASQSGASSRFGQLSDKRSGELDSQEVVSARTRERHGQADMNTRANSSRIFPSERHLQGGAHSRVPRDESHSQGGVSSRTRRTRGEGDFFNSHSSNSRDSDTRDPLRLDVSSWEPDEWHGGLLSSMCDNSRSAYNLRDSSRLHTVKTGTFDKDTGAVGSSLPSSISREGGNNTGILQLRSILDEKENSRGSVGVLTRREAKERQNLQLPTLLDKDNSRGSVGVMTRRQEAKGSQALQAMSVLDDKDSSGGSTGPFTRREANQSRSRAPSQDKGQSLSRNHSRDEQVKLMKEQCFNSVKTELDPILHKGTIDKSQYKELARSATHSILSSLGVPGLRHGSDVASFGNVTCPHEELTSSHLIPGCCNLCVQRHVKRYVKNLVREKVTLHR